VSHRCEVGGPLAQCLATAQKNLDSIGDSGDTLRMKQQLARNTQRMKDSSNTLRDAERLTYEMNETADSTLIELERQRGQIQHIGETVRATDEELSQVQRILRKMHKEMLKNKLMLSGVIAMLLIMIIGILYYKFGGTSATHSSEASGVSGGDNSVPVAAPDPQWIPTMPPTPPPDAVYPPAPED
jgi:cytochrome c-type biogenesis protein CcmH/NrfG